MNDRVLDDPRIDPRLKAVFSQMPSAHLPHVPDRETQLAMAADAMRQMADAPKPDPAPYEAFAPSAGLTIRKGTNDIYLYFQVGRDNDPRGTGIGSLFVVPVQFLPPARKKVGGVILKGPVKVTPEGNGFTIGATGGTKPPGTVMLG